jgi:hypothetical protein
LATAVGAEDGGRFPETGRESALELIDSQASPTGVTIQVYRPTGRPPYSPRHPVDDMTSPFDGGPPRLADRPYWLGHDAD